MESGEDPIYKEGWLTKEGRMVKSWKKRWFVLQGTTFDYFEDDTGFRPKGSLSMEGTQVRAVAPTGKDKNAPFGHIELICEGRKLNFAAPTKEENQQWADVLTLKAACLRYLKRSSEAGEEVDWRIVRCFADQAAPALSVEDVPMTSAAAVAIVTLFQYTAKTPMAIQTLSIYIHLKNEIIISIDGQHFPLALALATSGTIPASARSRRAMRPSGTPCLRRCAKGSA